MKKLKLSFSRHSILSALLMLAIVMIIIRLIDLQVVNGQKYYDKVRDVIVTNAELQGERGLILDKNGIKLAYNIKAYDVVIYYRRKSTEQLNRDILALYDFLAGSNEKVESGLPDYLTVDPIAFGKKLTTDAETAAWLKQMANSENDIKQLITPEDVFRYFRDNKFYISDEYSEEDAYKIMCVRYKMLIDGYSQITPLLIASDVSAKTMAGIELMKNDIPGVYTEERYVRRYISSDAFSAVTGYIRPIELSEVEDYFTLGYKMNELVGKDGLEKSFEKYLRAVDGIKTAVLEPGQYELEFDTSIDPTNGYDLATSIDSGVQQEAYDSLKKNIARIVSGKDGTTNFGDAKYGAAVMMDVKTGRIIALVSYPGYDANAFVTNDEAEVKRITEDADKLQLNRAIQGLYPPGSAFKPLTAIAALEEGTYKTGELVTDTGVINYDGMDFYSMDFKKYGITYGDIDLEYALQVSANVFFYKIGVATGIDKLDKWARIFGLGEKTGIDIGGEEQGRRNSRQTMTQIEPDRNWGRADTAQASIGQLYNQFTPIQLVRYISAIANGGRLYKPSIVTGIYKRDGSGVISFDPEYVDTGASLSYLREVQKGMLAVSNATDGTAVDIFKDFPYGKVASKTGTPETGMEASGVSSHSVFVCYAPYDDPQVAVCVIIENGVWGSNAAPVAYDMLIKYFESK
jgi:penicillin-binding protein 2